MSLASDSVRPPADTERCPCLSGEVYGECCAPFHRGEAHAPTAERLMRSRYSAFAVGDADYLLATWHPDTRPADLELDPGLRWFRLDILGRTGGRVLDSEGTVEFEARYRMRPTTPDASPTSGSQRENSRFRRVDGRWFYVDAV
ncbi:YchJ family protein [Herbiconiux sp. UC225_62]|uniref:YchJ family protein n=1 Tax=Herbiconiux sp. UC225_62 TaxID=3350168 RepID=UPI0036D3B831